MEEGDGEAHAILALSVALPVSQQTVAGYRSSGVGRQRAMFTLNINGRNHEVDVPSEMPLLWVVRDVIGMTGTKFGCGIAQCGACTMHLDGVATRTCVLPVSAVGSKKITTIEGLGTNGLHALQQAWIDEQVPQCGYCQPGQLMAAASLLAKNPHPSDSDIDAAMTNICRCGTYGRIKRAIARVASGKTASG